MQQVNMGRGQGFLRLPRRRPGLPVEARFQLRDQIGTFDRLAANRPDGDTQSLRGSKQEIDRLRLRLEEQPETLWWSDLAQAEECIIDALDDSIVVLHLLSWRRRLREVIGEARYALYKANSEDTDSPNPDYHKLRADLSECVRSVYYFYAAYGEAARSRTEVAQETFVVALAILAFEGILAIIVKYPAPKAASYWLTLTQDAVKIAAYVIAASAAAVLGSVVSVQRRLEDPSIDIDPTYRYIQTKADRFSVAFVSPIFGAIFGAVTYALLGVDPLSWTLSAWRRRVHPWQENILAPTRWSSGLMSSSWLGVAAA